MGLLDFMGGVEEPEIDYRALYDDYSQWLADAKETRDYETGNLNQQIQSAIVRGHSPDSAYIRNLRERGQSDIDEAYAGQVKSLQEGVTFQNLKGFAENGIRRDNVSTGAVARQGLEQLHDGRGFGMKESTHYAGDKKQGVMGMDAGVWEAGETYKLDGIQGMRAGEQTVEERPEKQWQLEGGGSDVMGYLDKLYGTPAQAPYSGASETNGQQQSTLPYTPGATSQNNQGGA